MELLTKGHTEFEQGYCRYLRETSLFQHSQDFDLHKILNDMEEQKLVKTILGLKKREQEILTARIFLAWDFTEIALTHGLTAKQTEMAYYYIIRKLRKELEGKRYD